MKISEEYNQLVSEILPTKITLKNTKKKSNGILKFTEEKQKKKQAII